MSCEYHLLSMICWGDVCLVRLLAITLDVRGS